MNVMSIVLGDLLGSTLKVPFVFPSAVTVVKFSPFKVIRNSAKVSIGVGFPSTVNDSIFHVPSNLSYSFLIASLGSFAATIRSAEANMSPKTWNRMAYLSLPRDLWRENDEEFRISGRCAERKTVAE